MKACPKCGSTEGWSRYCPARLYEIGNWKDQGAVDFDFVYIRHPKTVKCIACNARFKLEDIGLDPDRTRLRLTSPL